MSRREPWFALAVLLWCIGSFASAPSHGDALVAPPVWAGMYIDNAVPTTDTTVNLLAVVTGYPQFNSTRSVTVKNDASSGGPGLLITLDGVTTATTPTVNTTQSTILIRPQESFQADGQYKTLHYRADAAGTIGMRGIFLY